MPVRTIRSFLDQHDVRYIIIQHSPAYTAQELAESVHVSGYQFAKSVMVELDGTLVQVVMPATRQLDLDALAEVTGTGEARLATEAAFSCYFPDCDPGAVPPFGNLFGLPVYICQELAQANDLAFNAGRHTEVMRLAGSDYRRLVDPNVVDI